jgi:hypothetical protein
MSDMPADPQHARSREVDTTLAAAWAVLLLLGGTQVTFNVASALHHASPSPVRVLAGVAPVLAAVLLSHLAASRAAAEWFRWVVGGVMLCSMAVSIGATIQVTAPVFGHLWREIIFGIVLDAASLLALWFIMDRHSAKIAAAAAELEAADALERARTDAADATRNAADAAAELTRFREQSAAQLATVREQLEADLAQARTGLAAADARATALNEALRVRRSSPSKRGAGSPRRKGAGSPPARDVGSPRGDGTGSPVNSGGSEDLDTEARALDILAAEPGIRGKELGRRLGVSESYGCRLRNRLAAVAPVPDQQQEPS